MIKDWLAKVRPPKYLRYLFFIGFSWYRRCLSERTSAHFKIVMFLVMMHMFAYQGFFFITTSLFEKSYAYLILLLTFIQFYIWFLLNEKWKEYVEEFKHISRKQQKRHIVYLFLYLLICLLPIIIPVYLAVMYDINIYKLKV